MVTDGGEEMIKVCTKGQELIDTDVDLYYTSSWTYGNGSRTVLYYCKEHEPRPKHARKEKHNGR